MDKPSRRKELADFLRTRRQRLAPADVGLNIDTSRRRTPGLRREEVAGLSGISLPWYTALEQAKDIRVSEQVLLSLAGTLQLSEDERNHFFILANAASSAPVLTSEEPISPILQQILDRFGTYPAYISNEKWNVIAWNEAAKALLGDFDRHEEIETNILWRIFMLETNKRQIVNWDQFAASLVAQFRSRYAVYIDDPWYTYLVHRLMEASADFRMFWERHDVSKTQAGKKDFILPKVGLLEFNHTTFSVSENTDFVMAVYTPAAGTPTDQRMKEWMALTVDEHN
ncbi:helix-turn-helix transcriptional regulator [Saccharibacillus sp. CPCC 101409]|uniref:helix-turn-helix transcriptional regulator n=1 Tax=Saccharibacillus sp. CPCC 101409 TaxID=3058041 RepID=UPI002670FA6B|nr:helix-turn-helix transcriptional regulator [Saccharibacillus sp. CPCC 101409]MDO3411233.1 helix-turn-helix transcriptional regulator [Saccharibacillus sp. CPCC 101409]